MKKYYLFWIIGILTSIIGISLTKTLPAGSLGNSAGYILAFTGLSIIAFGIKKNASKSKL